MECGNKKDEALPKSVPILYIQLAPVECNNNGLSIPSTTIGLDRICRWPWGI